LTYSENYVQMLSIRKLLEGTDTQTRRKYNPVRRYGVKKIG
jgi:hypothetical protein